MKTRILLLTVFSFFHFSHAQFTLQDSLVAHYPFDGNALDVSGNGNHGTVVGPRLTTDRFGTPNAAYQFDGIDDYMDFLNNMKFKPQLPVTIAAWVFIDSPGEDIVFRNDYRPSTYDGVWFTIVNSSQGNRVLSAAYGDGGGIGPQSRRTKNGYTTLNLNQWYHVAAVIRGPGDADVFLNGKNDCGFYSGNGSTLSYSNNGGKIGEWYPTGGTGSSNWFHGKLDDIRFYNRELSIEEIRTLAGVSNISTLAVCQGETTQLDASDGSVGYQWSPAVGLSCTSCPNPTATVNDTTIYQVIRTNTFACPDTVYFQLNTRDCNVSVCDPSFTLQDSLVAHYPFDGSALDVSGNGNHGIVVGPTLSTDRFGNPNSAFQFDGVDDYMDFLNNQKFKPQLPVTIASWIYIDSPGEDIVFRNDYQPATYDGVWLTVVNSSQGNRVISAAYGDGGGIGPQSRQTKNGYSSLDIGKWHHIAAVIRGPGDMDVFLDGNNDCGFYSGNGGILNYTNADGKIGEWYSTGGTGFPNWFHGKLDDIRFYNRELCIDEIRILADYTSLQTLNICSGTTTTLDASDGSSSYSWSPSLGLSCTTCPDPQASPSDTTLYQVIRDNGFNCPDTLFYQLNVENCNLSPCDPSFTLQDSLVAHYPMSGNLLDASGLGNNGTANGPVLTTDRFGNPNEAYFFDGVDDIVIINANDPKFKPPLPVTIAAWIEIADYDLNNVFQNDFTAGRYHGPWMNIVNGKVNANYGDGGFIGPTWRRSKAGSSTLNLNQWYHLAVVIRGPRDMSIYIDGVEDCGIYSGSGQAMAYSLANGRMGEGTSASNLFFHGKMDDVRLYNRELCIYEVRELADFNNMEVVDLCIGDSAALDVNDGSVSYQWSPTTDLSCTTCSNPLAFPSDTTIYSVIRNNGFNCLDTLFFKVNPYNCQSIPPCDTTLLEADFEYTTDGLVLTGINQSRGPDSGIDRWRWNFGDGNSRSVFQPDTITHQYFMPGTYDVCLVVEKFYDELNVCLDTFCQTVMVDSIANSYGENLEAFGWKLSPNPASTSILLEKEETPPLPIELKIFDLSGKILLEKSFLFNTKTEIPVQYLSPGLYILQIKEEQKLGYWKFLKE